MKSRRTFLKSAVGGLIASPAIIGRADALALILRAPSAGFNFITDTAIHQPPNSGTWEYSPPGTFQPENSPFPGLVGTYVDPVFGTTVKRLTVQAQNLGSYDGGDIYEKQGWWSANGTYFVHTFLDSTVSAVRVADGVKFPLTNAGSGPRQDASCHPVNDNEFYYRTATQMKKQLISTGAISTLNGRTFTALGSLGGSLDVFDNTGQYMIINTGTGGGVNFTVWDIVNDIVFTGGGTWDPAGGWATITPDGNNLIVVGATHRYKYAVDKINHTVATADTQFMATQVGSDHGNLSMPGDGNVYFINVNNDSNPALLQRTNIATGVSTTFFSFPTDAYFSFQPDHFSCPKLGSYKDWVFCSSDQTDLQATQYNADLTSSSDPWTVWQKGENEIYMVNILTGALRRLVHHRSRQSTPSWNYSLLPRVCAYWGGTTQYFAWISNHGVITTPVGYQELFMMTVPV